MFRKSLLLTVVLLGSTEYVFAVNAVKPLAPEPVVIFRPTETEEEAGKYITQNLLVNHFRKVSVNDSLSQQIFNRYIDNLDGTKSYFVASEVESLRKIFGARIYREFLAGKSNSGFGIYNFFLKRAKEKMRFMRAAADTIHFNFSVPETIDLDRKSDHGLQTAASFMISGKKS